MNAFIVDLANKPGELARSPRRSPRRASTSRASAGATAGGRGAVVLVTNDEAGTRRALADAGCTGRARSSSSRRPRASSRARSRPPPGSSPTPASTSRPRCRSAWPATRSGRVRDRPAGQGARADRLDGGRRDRHRLSSGWAAPAPTARAGCSCTSSAADTRLWQDSAREHHRSRGSPARAEPAPVRRHPAGPDRARLHRHLLGQPRRRAPTAASCARRRCSTRARSSSPAPAGRASTT